MLWFYQLSVLVNLIVLFVFCRNRYWRRHNAKYLKPRNIETGYNHASALIFYGNYSLYRYSGWSAVHPFAELAKLLGKLNMHEDGEVLLDDAEMERITHKVFDLTCQCDELLLKRLRLQENV